MKAAARSIESPPRELRDAARVAATSRRHWDCFFEGLRAVLPLDRICALVQVDAYTGLVARVAQVGDLEPMLGGAGVYLDRERSKAFEVLAAGQPALIGDEEWTRHADLQFFWPTLRSNIKILGSLGGWPTVLNIWSRLAHQYGAEDVVALAPVAAQLSRSPVQLERPPIGLALRQLRALQERRAALLQR